jgi:hypothetical protein
MLRDFARGELDVRIYASAVFQGELCFSVGASSIGVDEISFRKGRAT